MPNCKFCNTLLPENETGRRPREFCDNKQKCRNLWHRKNKKEVKANTIELPKDYVNWESIGIIRKDGTVEELKDLSQLPESFQIAARGLQEVGKDTVGVAIPNNEHITVAYQEPKNTNPKNLDQLKLLCPKELTGFDRSEWIRTERLKYSI